jgi:hypothetical protein
MNQNCFVRAMGGAGSGRAQKIVPANEPAKKRQKTSDLVHMLWGWGGQKRAAVECVASGGNDDGDGDGHDDGDDHAGDDEEGGAPTATDPLPGVNSSSIPEIFRKQIGEKLQDSPQKIKSAKPKQSNQHQKSAPSSSRFPWKNSGLELHWKDANLIGDRPVILADFLLPFFTRVKVFLPSHSCTHQLPHGKMPCEWHGCGSDCVVKDSILNLQGPRIAIHAVGSIIHLFSSRFTCRKRESQKANDENDEKDVDYEKHPHCCFVGHCKEVLNHLPPGIRESLDLVIARKHAVTVGLLKCMMEGAARGHAFSAKHRELVSLQKSKFHRGKHSFLLHICIQCRNASTVRSKQL